MKLCLVPPELFIFPFFITNKKNQFMRVQVAGAYARKAAERPLLPPPFSKAKMGEEIFKKM
jgi:hypothetical protein